MATKPVKEISARRKLELSQVSPGAVQREAMAEDTGFDKLVLYFARQISTSDMAGRITEARINRTIEGASTLTLVINDYDRALLRSDLLTHKLDVQIDGLWFRLTAVDKNGDELTLTFEDREVSILRTYNKWRIAQRGQMTRAEFIYSLIKEVKEFKIPVVIPEMTKIQPIEKFEGDIYGVDTIVTKTGGIYRDMNKKSKFLALHLGEQIPGQGGARLTVKGAAATPDQIQNANIILKVADSLGVSRRLKVIAIMTAITESVLRNNPGGDNAHGGGKGDSAGLFQQYEAWGSYFERTDPATSARLFFNGNPQKGVRGAIYYEKTLGDSVPYWVIAADTQNPRENLRSVYATYRVEAEKFVNAYGDIGGAEGDISVEEANNMWRQLDATGAEGPYFFYRGTIVDKRGQKRRKPEDTWKCAQRLADDVDWRAFFVSGTFYFISETLLFKQQPIFIGGEFNTAIDSIDGNLDQQKKSASVEIKARIGRWTAPPGSVVVLEDMGPFDGRWLVNDYERSLIGEDRTATITLKKPRPKLPEPRASNKDDLAVGWAPGTVTQDDVPAISDLIDAVLRNPSISFSHDSQRSDIKLGQIDERILQLLMFITGRGYSITLTSLKTDHDLHTNSGNISLHSIGHAVDIGTINGIRVGNNDLTKEVMKLIGFNPAEWGLDELIGPFPLLTYGGPFDLPTLNDHKDHIHAGVTK